VLPLIRTLFDIALLRKGPEHVPHSGILLLMSLLLWVLAISAYNAVFSTANGTNIERELFSFVLGLVCTYGILTVTQHSRRALQMFTALIGCSAVLITFFIAAMVAIGQPLGDAVSGMLVLSYLIWSLSVEGHIIARTIGRAFYIGVIIAFAIFVLQIGMIEVVYPRATDS